MSTRPASRPQVQIGAKNTRRFYQSCRQRGFSQLWITAGDETSKERLTASLILSIASCFALPWLAMSQSRQWEMKTSSFCTILTVIVFVAMFLLLYKCLLPRL